MVVKGRLRHETAHRAGFNYRPVCRAGILEITPFIALPDAPTRKGVNRARRDIRHADELKRDLANGRSLQSISITARGDWRLRQ
jgi:hypothetical protein